MRIFISVLGVFIFFVSLFSPCLYASEAVRVPEAKATDTKDKERDIRIDFRDAEISTIINFLAKLSNLIVVMGDDIKGRVSVTSPTPLNLNEVYEVLMAVLETKGITLVRTDKLLKAIPKRDAAQKWIDTYYGADPKTVPFEDRVITQIAPVQYGKASDMLNNIRPLISPTGNAFVSNETNVIVITDVATNIRKLLAIVKHLDVSRIEVVEEDTRVYPVRYMKAKDIGDALGKVFAEKKGDKQEVKVTPVETVNALIVTANKNAHPRIKQIVDSLDIRKKQVLIEAKIVEATLSKGLDFGINLAQYLLEKGGVKHTITMKGGLANPLVSYTIKSDRLDATLNMLAEKKIINIISSPRILTSDNQKAKIIVGQEQPILKSVTDLGGTQGGTTGKTVSDFVYKDVGIDLEVTPRINVDKDVAMDVSFKITSILSEVEFPGNIKAPQMGKREASTGVIIMDGYTLVIGGMRENGQRDERQKIPILGDIPLIGLLFSKIRKVNNQTELLVFITPHVVENTAEGEDLTESETEKTGEDFRKIYRESLKPKKD